MIKKFNIPHEGKRTKAVSKNKNRKIENTEQL
jgi:hypothetical protein